MATISKQQRTTREIAYPTTDGKPMAETEIHRDDMTDTIQMLQDYFAAEPHVYVGGNLLLCYEEGKRRKHVAPDVFVALGASKEPKRENYLVWKEGRAPDWVVEITSKSTRRQDEKTKLAIYRDILRVREYFLFDPRAEYLDPPLQGFRLVGGDYVGIEAVEGRLHSEVLGLDLERDGTKLRLFNPATGEYLPTRLEASEAERQRADEQRRQAEAERQRADEQRRQAEAERQRADEERQRAEAADRRADEERQRADEERQRAEAADRRADEERQRADEERQRAEAADAARRRDAEELERLRREIEALRRG
jgi:Uma2 family endonuclease